MPLEMKYFVLKPKSKRAGDPYAVASRMALVAYAVTIEDFDPDLAESLREWTKRELDRERGL